MGASSLLPSWSGLLLKKKKGTSKPALKIPFQYRVRESNP